jgi:hypothetical protein
LEGEDDGIKGCKAKVVADHAARAYQEGRQVFMLRVNPGLLDGGTTGPAYAFAEQIEAVESAGWWLQHMGFAGDEKRASGYFLLRRRQ